MEAVGLAKDEGLLLFTSNAADAMANTSPRSRSRIGLRTYAATKHGPIIEILGLVLLADAIGLVKDAVSSSEIVGLCLQVAIVGQENTLAHDANKIDKIHAAGPSQIVSCPPYPLDVGLAEKEEPNSLSAIEAPVEDNVLGIAINAQDVEDEASLACLA